MMAAANIARAIALGFNNTDHSILWTAGIFTYGCLALVPLVVFFFAKISSPYASVNYAHLICVYGYSGVSLIPSVFLCAIPVLNFQKISLAAGAANSALFLYINLWDLVNSANPTLRLVTVGTAIACQAASYLAFFYLFLFV
jgi:hypothetical protein